MNIEKFVLSVLGDHLKPATEEEMIRAVSGEYSKQLAGMVFMPSGEGLLVVNNEQAEEK